MPDLLANEKWHVVAERERLDGAECLVIESKEKNKLWLDPKAGFAVRRWTIGNPMTHEREYHDLRQVAGDFWMPQSITATWYGEAPLPKEFHSKPVMRWRYQIDSFEFNEAVPDELFRLKPPAGALVWDCTIKPLDAAGQPTEVGSYGDEAPFAKYIQPKNPEDLPQVVKAAAKGMVSLYPPPGQTKSASLIQQDGATNQNPLLPTNANPVSWFVAINVVILLVGAGYLAYRRFS